MTSPETQRQAFDPVSLSYDIPKAVGQDGGKFMYQYDKLADELDDDLVKSLKEQLDGILIFVRLTRLSSRHE